MRLALDGAAGPSLPVRRVSLQGEFRGMSRRRVHAKKTMRVTRTGPRAVELRYGTNPRIHSLIAAWLATCHLTGAVDEAMGKRAQRPALQGHDAHRVRCGSKIDRRRLQPGMALVMQGDRSQTLSLTESR